MALCAKQRGSTQARSAQRAWHCAPADVHRGLALKSGMLVPVLEKYHAPEIALYAIYPPTRHLSSKVRLFIDFLLERFRDRALEQSKLAFHSSRRSPEHIFLGLERAAIERGRSRRLRLPISMPSPVFLQAAVTNFRSASIARGTLRVSDLTTPDRRRRELESCRRPLLQRSPKASFSRFVDP